MSKDLSNITSNITIMALFGDPVTSLMYGRPSMFSISKPADYFWVQVRAITILHNDKYWISTS